MVKHLEIFLETFLSPLICFDQWSDPCFTLESTRDIARRQALKLQGCHSFGTNVRPMK